MIYVLYKNAGVLSGRALRRALGKVEGIKVSGGFPSHLATQKTTPKLLINLGTTEDVKAEKLVLNPRAMVIAASHKLLAREQFRDQGVPTPPLFRRVGEIKEEDLPVVGRTTRHHKGQGFWLCRTLREVSQASSAGATHFLGFIPNTREYRVHTFIRSKSLGKPVKERTPEDYKSIKISEKVWTGKGTPDPNIPQKNHQFGWTFLGQQNRREEELAVVRQSAKMAIAALGMDFGAVDIMYQIRYKLPYVLEINSTPSLADENSDTCERYAGQITKIYQAQ